MTTELREQYPAGSIWPGPQTKTVRLATGPLIRYVEQGDPSAGAIVCLHGYTDSWYSFSRLLPWLARAGHHVYAFDQRGHGCSERPATGYAVDDFAADVDAFLDAVGATQATIVGHSMGSLIARAVAEQYPDRVNRLVLIGTALSLAGDDIVEMRAALDDMDETVSEEFVREFQASTIHTSVPAPFFERVVAESLRVPARVWRQALDGLLAFDDLTSLSAISAPTLILSGERDAFLSPLDRLRLVGAIRRSRLTVYENIGHSPHWEQPDAVARDLEAFIRET